MSDEEGYSKVAKDTEVVGVPEKEDEQPIELTCAEEICELKWRTLILICFLTFGGYYIYDFPGSLGIGRAHSIESVFAAKGKDFTSEMNQALYSVYSWPNTVVATFGGILIDNYIGLRKSLMLFVTLDAIGAVIFYFGVLSTSYPVMLVGRLVFGLGNESLSVAQNAYVARYFRGRYGLALAFGIVISFSRVGSSFNFLFSPRIAEAVSVEMAVLVGAFACALSVVAAGLLNLVDLYAEKKKIYPPQQLKKDESGKGGFKFKDLKAFTREFWAICAICCAIYCAVFPFVGVGKPFFEVKYDVDSTLASTYLSLFQFSCAGFSPFAGGVIDGVGRTAQWLVTAGSGFTLVHLLFLVAKPSPYGMTVFMGVVYSILAASLWPAVPYVVAPSSVGLAYGVMNSAQNAALAIYPLVSGAILDAQTPPKPILTGACYNYSQTNFLNDSGFAPGSLVNCSNNTDNPLPYLDGFRNDEILFMGTAAAGILFSIMLGIFSKANDSILLVNNAERKIIFAAKLARWKREDPTNNGGEAPAAVAVEKEENIHTGSSTPAKKRSSKLGDEKTGLLNSDSSRNSSTSMARYDQ